MSSKNTAVFGIYADREAVEEGVGHLRAGGFRSTDISVLVPENTGTKDFGHEKNSKAPEGATSGVVAGGITGGVLGWLTGIGMLAIPGLGPFLAAGPNRRGAFAGARSSGHPGRDHWCAGPEWEFPSMRLNGSKAAFGKAAFLSPVHCDNAEWVKRGQGTSADYRGPGDRVGWRKAR